MPNPSSHRFAAPFRYLRSGAHRSARSARSRLTLAVLLIACMCLLGSSLSAVGASADRGNTEGNHGGKHHSHHRHRWAIGGPAGPIYRTQTSVPSTSAAPASSTDDTPSGGLSSSTSPSDPTDSSSDPASQGGSSSAASPVPGSSSPPTSDSASPAPTSSAPVAKRCATDPSSCGFPDASTTGPQSGVTLIKVPGQQTSGPGWKWDNLDGMIITGAGATVSGFDIDGSVAVKADNVTINNVRITEEGDWWGIGLYHANNVTISNTEISSPYATGPRRLGAGIHDVYGDALGTRLIAANIFHTSTGVQFNNGLIQDSYIHDLGFNDGDHLNGTTSNAGSDQMLTIRHNTIFNNNDQTDAVSLFEDFGAQHNALIADNLLAGGGYTIYGGANDGGAPTSNITITGNRFSTLYAPNGGGYGPIACFDPNGAGNAWSDNSWIDGPNAGRSIGPDGDTN